MFGESAEFCPIYLRIFEECSVEILSMDLSELFGNCTAVYGEAPSTLHEFSNKLS